MHQVLVIGAGKIGSLITFLLAHSNNYSVFLADIQEDNPLVRKLGQLPNFNYVKLDAKDTNSIAEFLKKNKIEAIISSLPYYCNVPIATVAAAYHVHYFDLTEDVETTNAVQALSQTAKSTFVPQCGLAPGFISIIANHLMKNFPELDTVKMRVGALPINISNALQYSLTWSTDGLINEYGNLCHAVENGEQVTLLPLEGLEAIKIDGLTYEAFNTSGGIGSLAQSYNGKVKHLSYKTIRYPGHCEKIKFLMNDLKLNEDRETLRRVLEHAIPKTYQDVVLVYVSVTGNQDDQFIEENYVKKFYPKKINGHRWSAIQLTTASGICSAVDLVLHNPDKYKGFVRQEQFAFDDLVNNQFGEYYK
ncbi:saccharopine dehydrogenase family protein [Aquicella lusitana]|uniref:Saccharopine dehydrogenase-like NADP-dependent oxidoreductase n=1 Tax=Aquicella lusitana TaxID=254246 RepID=A0A370GDY4_9COXI|nr:saccharopine dehydrogenase C-terminal domain-containing protein [Aquicella lusitana]RDI40203.1 saccharopine dehydrogenase-like NADP-dependent oxidoreductase [Aquicella lusitana]VVC72406.1 Lysine 6-dehydrogenase [Aquicella lusitana]